MAKAMQIKKIKLENIRCFETLDIDLSVGKNVRNWALILGDNGVGKTTFLRSIALCLGDRESAAALLRDLPGEWVRRESSDRTGTIRVEFVDAKSRIKNCYTEIVVKNSDDRETIEDYNTKPDNFPWDRMFACGYGAARGVFGHNAYQKYRTIDSVYTLFDYETRLQNPEVMLHRLGAGQDENIREILETIDRILMLDPGSTKLDASGISIRGPWGQFMPIDAVGDGYKAMLTWVVDFLGWAMLHKGGTVTRDNIGGIILWDEMEQHLHPRWQREIIKLVRERFPTTQFIGTTHSPLCAAGTADLNDETFRLLNFKASSDRSAIVSEEIESLRGLRADQVLMSSAFDLTETRNVAVEQLLSKFRDLLLKKELTKKEEQDLADLRQQVQQEVPGLAERTEDRQLQQEVGEWVRQVEQEKSVND